MSMIPDWLRRSVHSGGGDGPERTRLTLGFIPLTDCAPLVIAKQKGWFERFGLEVELSRETSWASIRDKVAIGMLDGAQMLAPMPLASTLGVGPVEKPTITALSLDLNGNAVTVSRALFERMQQIDPEGMRHQPLGAGPLKQVIDERKVAGEAALTFATVFPVSTHSYELRYWMASAGIDPDRDVRLLVVPPAQMVSQLQAGNIDGFCVGEPWNSLAVTQGLGRVLITSYEIWNNNPEKVFGVNREWAERYPKTHRALLMALLEAGRWTDAPEHRPQVVDAIARVQYINAPLHVVGMSMTGEFRYGSDLPPVAMPDFNVFYRFAATFPWRSHAAWFLTQMLRWGQIDSPIDINAIAAEVVRPDLYREAARALGMPTPDIDNKVEGDHAKGWILDQADHALAMGPDRFFDGKRYDPADPIDYLKGFELQHCGVDLSALARANSAEPPALVA